MNYPVPYNLNESILLNKAETLLGYLCSVSLQATAALRE
jgi:hypothetical protein